MNGKPGLATLSRPNDCSVPEMRMLYDLHNHVCSVSERADIVRKEVELRYTEITGESGNITPAVSGTPKPTGLIHEMHAMLNEIMDTLNDIDQKFGTL